MPFQEGRRLPGERASKIGHLEVLKSELVQKLCKSFEDPNEPAQSKKSSWIDLPTNGNSLSLVFGVDGSIQVIESGPPFYKALAFVKTALLRLDEQAIASIDQNTPHPFAIRDILSDSALYHATVFPLRHVIVPGLNTYDAIRRIIYDSMSDPSLHGEPMETFKWIVYEKWDGKNKQLPFFECPSCHENVATLTFDLSEGNCPKCNAILFVTDMLGFHQEMSNDSAPDTVATAYMNIHETVLMFTGIRHFWENNRKILEKCLFIKDGPLSIRAQYSKLVNPIRRFLAHARNSGSPINIIGQEKSGTFFDHLQLISSSANEKSIFIPGDEYIKNEIQHRPDNGAPYGKDTNYGAKVFLKVNNYHSMVLNIPTGEYVENPTAKNLIGLENIIATLPKILSNRFEGALLPVELANGVASLSTYPSAHILKIFSESK